MVKADSSQLKAGVIEGFFGTAWNWPDRAACVEFLGRSGYHFYLYAPKSDPFLRKAWREPMPPALEESLTRLRRHCGDNGVSFGVGLTPFELYRDYGGGARRDLHDKVRQIDRIGADVLCILFDDMRGDVADLAQLQARIVADIASWTRAPHLIFCPTYYSTDPLLERVFGPKPPRYHEDLCRLVDRRIDFFWTGERVCSPTYAAGHLLDVEALIGRKPFIWDNNITNDSKLRSKFLFMTPDAVTPGAPPWALPAGSAAGVAINPMNQPYLSFLALCAYARMLGLRGEGAMPARDCFSDCGTELRPQLLADLDAFQKAGLDGIGEMARQLMLARYGSFDSNPYARDIAAWLRGDYTFDPACLTA